MHNATETRVLVLDWYEKQTVILGCGNQLFGDDGFGPAVAEYCQRNFSIPAHVCMINAGTSVRNVLFDILLADEKPAEIVILDAMECGREAGELFELDIDSFPSQKTDDFSMHQVPTSNLLRELRDLCDIDVVVLACQVEHIPESVAPGLSDCVGKSVERAAHLLARKYLKQ